MSTETLGLFYLLLLCIVLLGFFVFPPRPRP